MGRFSFQKVSADEEEDEDDDEEFFKRGGDYFYSRIAATEVESVVRKRRSFHRSSSVLSSALSLVGSRKSFSYDKLSQVPIQLTVIKLDGSSFEIDVRNMGTIAELKQAVERKFSHLPTKGPGKISWRHVWGHFCLSHRGHKLLHDSDYLNDYGIKDGDQLRFVRHVSIAYNLIKKQSRKRIEAPKPITIADYNEEESKKSEVYEDIEDLRCQQYKNEVEDNSTQNDCMLSHLFSGWFLYSKLSNREHTRFGDDIGRSRWAGGFVGCFRSLFHFSDNRPSNYSSRVSQVEI
ncbi:hypothetical protein RND81_08G205300 [Saponaria officinalis]|uniref:Ubiquitin-like domain-containing protein n=1 Tax=Saponaria officinalis TaxID=3572 RepID=A0AAW1JAB1_SAPOF